MRYVTYLISTDRGYFNRGEEVFRQYGVALEAIHDIDVLNDGTMVMRYEVDATRDQLDASLAQADEKVVNYHLVETAEGFMIQLQYYPDDLITRLLDIHQNHCTMFDFPLEFIDPESSTLRASNVGPVEEIRALIATLREEASITIEQLGSYNPDVDRRLDALTERQREVLATAVDLGYYELPREATHADIAAELDCSAAAVGKHLQRIEATLVSDTLNGLDGDAIDSAASR